MVAGLSASFALSRLPVERERTEEKGTYLAVPEGVSKGKLGTPRVGSPRAPKFGQGSGEVSCSNEDLLGS